MWGFTSIILYIIETSFANWYESLFEKLFQKSVNSNLMENIFQIYHRITTLSILLSEKESKWIKKDRAKVLEKRKQKI